MASVSKTVQLSLSIILIPTNDGDVPRIGLVRVTVLLQELLQSTVIDRMLNTYDPVVLGQFILFVKSDILVSKEHHATLRGRQSQHWLGIIQLIVTSAARSASSSFCSGVNWLSWTPTSSVPI